MIPFIRTPRPAGRSWISAAVLAAVMLLAPRPAVAVSAAGEPPAAGAGALALGDSAVGLLSSLPQRDTFTLALTAGDTVDIGVFSRTRSWLQPGLTLLDDLGAVVGSRRLTRPAYWRGGADEIVIAVAVPRTGTYRVIVSDATEAPNQFYGCPCGYAVYSRRAGPVLETTGGDVYRNVREGTAAAPPDPEFRVYNRGSGSATFTVALDPAVSWLTPSRTAGTAFGAPPGGGAANPVVVRMTANAAGLAKGSHDGMISFQGPDDVWNGTDRFRAHAYVYDARSVVLDTTLYTQISPLAVAPDGTLAIASAGEIYRMNPATGAYTRWVSGLNQYLGGIAFGADSALYVADRVEYRVLRISPAGVVSTLFTTAQVPLGVVVLPDGTLFASAGRSLFRRSPQGTLTTLLTRPSRNYGSDEMPIAYLEGWLYYLDNGQLGRVNAVTGVDELRGNIPEGFYWTLLAGQSGRLYSGGGYGGVAVLDDTGHEVERLYPPLVNGLALGDGVLYGTSGGYWTWKLPLADGPATATVLVGDPSGDGQVTSLDALGVLSYVVGKPLPAGWNMRLGGDADCDGEVTSVDALVILSKIVGKDVAAFCVGSRR